MKIYKYSITLNTPMGIKKGTLIRYAEYNRDAESGYIEALGKKNPYLAKVRPDGECSMTVTLKTIIRDHNFCGSGYIYPDKLDITLHGGKANLLMQGEIKEVTSENEKVL